MVGTYFELGFCMGMLATFLLALLIMYLIHVEKEKTKWLKTLNDEEYRRYTEYRRRVD